jgi:hypothetical protein
MNKQLLTEGFWIDIGILYWISKKLITPFKKWRAFELKLIDENGRTIKQPKTSEEKDAFTYLDKFVRNLRILIGDNAFLKLGLSSLLVIDFKSDKYKNESLEDSLFKYLKENVSKSMISIDVMLSASGENIYFYYNEDLGNVDLNISMQYGGESMSAINGLMLPKESTRLFLDRLNYAFNNLDLGGSETIELNDGAIQHNLFVNYGGHEIKVSKEEFSDNLSANLSLMLNDNQKNRFVDGWNNFYAKVRAR